ncbi:hypothetical protein [Streptomyces zagrosensis]|uniref:Uncharacterized protein n=1 Tax=Streptomyces zagrosensis TaxID=1042984 RepID=A0A7W9QA70_9ACTN|nr:hypothetical protein [Streptomyces zagrosensis]MBB5936409.1 hypothetical protein [Streptomyces zagrosensis]
MTEMSTSDTPACSAGGIAPYEAPAAVRAGTLVSLAAGTYSTGEQDDGDYHTTKWHD